MNVSLTRGGEPMLGQPPGLTPEGDDSAHGLPRFAWAEGSAEAGPVPAEVPGGAVGPDGLDYEALLEALAVSGRLADPDGDQEAVLDDELAAAGDGRMSSPDLGWIAGLAGRVTLTITQHTITTARQAAGPGPPSGAGPPAATNPDTTTGPPAGANPDTPATPPRPITIAALRAATAALDRALTQARANQAAGGCAHTSQSPAYRPPPRLREHVIARDRTCRNPACRQPAWRADLDHTHPYDQDGRTCDCNLGGPCRIVSRHWRVPLSRRWRAEACGLTTQNGSGPTRIQPTSEPSPAASDTPRAATSTP